MMSLVRGLYHRREGGHPKLVSLGIHHGGCFTPTPSMSYVGGQGVAIEVDNKLRMDPIEIDSNPDVNSNLIPMCSRNLTKEWEEISSKALSIGISRKKIIVHVYNSSKVENVVNYDMLYEIERVGPIENFKEVEVDKDNEIYKESDETDTEENDASGSDDESEDLDYDPKDDEGFDDEHILEDVHGHVARKMSFDELASQSCLSSKLSRKGKLVKCSLCRDVVHNKKG
uniref:Uncharacterized protein n=1 Tax=Tanacetum cinerariifolium TaxID=118510 RepID=A0A699GWM2_TANCI|nr:hypothetical protein [Tanacetum cinerariifolium]